MVLVTVMAMSTIFIIMAGGLSGIALLQKKLNAQQVARHTALHVAEAGVNYYRWHLAHDQDDFMDGTGNDPGGGGEPYGPYTHAFSSPGNTMSGTYVLEITPPPTGSTIVKIRSTGWINSNPKIKRTIEVRYGIPSLAKFSFLTNSDTWFGPMEGVVGEMHSNGGIRMDGTNDALITSARQTYTCPSGQSCDTQITCNAPCTWNAVTKCTCPGIWGAGAGSSLWTYPVTTVNFDSITADLDTLRTLAINDGVHLDVGGSNKGYHIIFKSNGRFDARLISALNNGIKQRDDDWSSWVNTAESIKTEGAATEYEIPANGIIFVEDGDVYVEGTVNGRATLVAATLPDQANKRRSIIINSNLRYFARDGSNILGLIAQKDVKVPKHAPTDLTIDAFLLAQYGRVFRNDYDPSLVNTKIEVYGGILTNKTWTWSWVSGGVVVDGYATTTSIYDPLATFSPPPSFPTSGEYTFISWGEE